MRHLNRTTIIATILILVVTAVVGPVAMLSAQASPTNPLLYPYNQPSGINFNIADVTNAWTAYKNARVTTNGAQGGVRVLWDDGASTVSEGMGYGMLFEVIFDEQSNFDGMWRYVSQHLDANGLMNWKIDSAGATTGTGAATDGDEDMALALVNACVKVQKGAWPASPSGYNYCTLATTMINNIYNTEVDKAGSAPSGGLPNNPGGELLPGDTWTTASQYPNGIVNLSYFSPGYYTVFGKFTNNTSGWDAVNARNYAITNLAQAQSGNCSKLVPNWATYNGAAQLVSWQTTEYGWWSWDAARFAWRVAVDKAWYNTANAQETMNEVGGFFSSVGIANVKAQYQLNGTSVDNYDSAFFNANAAAAIWAAPAPIAVNCGAATATLKSTPQQAYDKLLSINDATSYYSSAWRLFGLILLTGNFPNIYELGQSAGQSTSTPTRTSTATTPSGPSVSIVDFAFQPNNLTINVGQTVTWTNTGSTAHTVTSDTNFWSSATVNPGTSFSFTFNAAGIYNYHCSFHGSMTGTITVMGGSATNTPTPTRTFTPTPVITLTGSRTPTLTGIPPNTFTPTGTPVITNTPTRTATPTGVCITATPVLMSVAPLISPTSATTQVIAVTLGSSTATVTVTSEAGSFVQTVSSGGVYSVTINLVPNSTNHLTVQAVVNYGAGCSYTLTRTTDSNANPLNIVQTTGVLTLTPTRTFTPTIPPVITNTPTRTFTPTTPPVLTNTPTQPTGGACTPTSTITAPFTWDGAGVYCWQIATIPGYVNNWNNNSVSINGTSYTNIYVASGSLPAKINNNYYISFNGSYAWSHLEVR
jgi:plastocyanin